MRWIIGVLIALALGIGVFLLWPRSTADPPTNTEAAGTSTTTTNTNPTSSTSIVETTTTTLEMSHVVDTVEEAEEILRELWFGWFEGIYNEDVERIREVVATESFMTAAVNAFGQLEFSAEPTVRGMAFQEFELLHSTEDCLAVWTVTRPNYLVIDGPRSGVEVLRWTVDGWKFASSWQLRNDLWIDDCDSELLPLP